jgi:uncharacterized protein (TIGR04141 family)
MSKKIQALTIFLIKPTAAELPLRSDAFPKHEIKAGETIVGNLYIKPSTDKAAGWLKFFEASLENLTERVVNANTSAVLLVSRNDRRFAITFGFGRSLLTPGCWEEDFGLKVTLNSVDPDKIKSVNRMSLDAIGQHSQIQASRESNIREFGLDLEQDLLRAVTGAPVDSQLGKWLTGKDELKIATDTMLSTLPSLLDALITQWQSEKYKEAFLWLDQIKEIKDPAKTTEFDALLIEQIKQEDFNRLWLTVPDLIDWSRIEGFKYRTAGSATVYSDVHIKAYLEEWKDTAEITVQKLKNRHVYSITQAAENIDESWSIYRCLYFETEQGGETFLLTNGKWYRVGTQFLTRVNEAYASIPKNSLPLPDFNDQSEGKYNERIATTQPQSYALMDEQLIYYPDKYSKVEFCDLFTKEKKMIHIKRYAGSSAPLSHLLAQAVVAGSLFRRDPEFRKKVDEKLPEGFGPITLQPYPDEYEIVFGVVSESDKDLVLPFFSRVNLKNAGDRLKELGYRISLTKIQAPKKIKKPTTNIAKKEQSAVAV